MNITYGRLRQFVEEAGEVEIQDSMGTRRILQKNSSEELWDAALRAGIFHWKGKPYTRSDFQRVLDRQFASRPADELKKKAG